MSEEEAEPKVIHYPFWVTRNRRADVPQLPYPDAMDEWIEGKPTGRVKIARVVGEGTVRFIGEVEQIEQWLCGLDEWWCVRTARAEWIKSHVDENREGRRRINNGSAHRPHQPAVHESIRHNGLKRNLRDEERMRACIEKFHHDLTVSDKELRLLLQYYGMLIRLCEASGLRYYLMREDAMVQHKRLLEMAKKRAWTQSIINMYGVIVEGVWEKIV